MKKDNDQLERHKIAKIEIGNTAITRMQKCVLIVAFFTTIFSVPVVQHIHEIRAFMSGKPERGTPWPQCYDILSSVSKPLEIIFSIEKPGQPETHLFTNASIVDRIFNANRVLLSDIDKYEDAVTDDSLLTEILLPPAQSILTGTLRVGNEQAYLGRDRWLFYRPSIDYLVGPGFLDQDRLIALAMSGSEWQPAPQPDALIAIFQFHKQLAERDIQLIVIPVPVKPMIHPEKFSSRYDGYNKVIQNPSYHQLKRELEKPELFFERYEKFLSSYRRVSVEKARKSWYWQFIEALEELEDAKDVILKNRVLLFDVASDLVEEKISTGRAQYLETETHWRPDTMQRVAKNLKAFLEKNTKLSSVEPIKYERETKRISNLGDIAVMMKLSPDQRLFPRQEVRYSQVSDGSNLWRPDVNAEILILGDSFSNVYSIREMGWGEAGGFAEQLSFELQRPVDAIIQNDNGGYATREMLSRELASGNDRLAGKKVVIWEFAMRELFIGDWRVKSTPMSLGEEREGHFLQIKKGDSRVVAGVVQEISSAPIPGTVPYSDHIINIHLRDLESHNGDDLSGNQALVAMYSMRDHVWTRAARYRVGQRIQIRLRNYDEVNRLYKIERINSSMLDSENALETPCWGEEMDLPEGSVSSPANKETVSSSAPGMPELCGIIVVTAIMIGIYLLVIRIEEKNLTP
ncbi:MAG: hypothetical protein KAV87_30240 [Desulfobacteraceae bacterium]|nr:hypothetical protein [Desulfobacteraceae bacterium]